MSKNFLAFLTTSSEEDSDLFRFFGVDESAADPGLEAGSFLLPSGFTAARFLDFFFVVEVVGVGVTPGVGTPSDVYSIGEKKMNRVSQGEIRSEMMTFFRDLENTCVKGPPFALDTFFIY